MIERNITKDLFRVNILGKRILGPLGSSGNLFSSIVYRIYIVQYSAYKTKNTYANYVLIDRMENNDHKCGGTRLMYAAKIESFTTKIYTECDKNKNEMGNEQNQLFNFECVSQVFIFALWKPLSNGSVEPLGISLNINALVPNARLKNASCQLRSSDSSNFNRHTGIVMLHWMLYWIAFLHFSEFFS